MSTLNARSSNTFDLEVGDSVIVRSQNRIGTIVKIMPTVFGAQWYKVRMGIDPKDIVLAEEHDLWAWSHWA